MGQMCSLNYRGKRELICTSDDSEHDECHVCVMNNYNLRARITPSLDSQSFARTSLAERCSSL